MPLEDEVHVLLGAVAAANGTTMEVVLFGPYVGAPTLDDAAEATVDDAIVMTESATGVIRTDGATRSWHMGSQTLSRGLWPTLGVIRGDEVAFWREPTPIEAVNANLYTLRDLTRFLVPGWVWETDPRQLSSWFFWDAGREWLEAAPLGAGAEFLFEQLAQVAAETPAGVPESMGGFGAVELAARVVVRGRVTRFRMSELPSLEPLGRAGAVEWSNAVPDQEWWDEQLMGRLATQADRVLDHLLEHSLWVADLRAGKPEVWDEFARQISVLRVWLQADWVPPQTREEAIADTNRLIANARDDADDAFDTFAPRPIPDRVDPVPKLSVMSWFQFDDVADWSRGALSAEGMAAVKEALERAIADATGDVIDGAVGLAAADIVARLVSGNDPGHGQTEAIGGVVEQRISDWVEQHVQVESARELAALAAEVVQLMRFGVLAEQVDDLDDESRAAWAVLLESIERRLRA